MMTYSRTLTILMENRSNTSVPRESRKRLPIELKSLSIPLPERSRVM